jgi:hypothetical protein
MCAPRVKLSRGYNNKNAGKAVSKENIILGRIIFLFIDVISLN